MSAYRAAPPRREIGETQHNTILGVSDGTRKKRPALPPILSISMLTAMALLLTGCAAERPNGQDTNNGGNGGNADTSPPDVADESRDTPEIEPLLHIATWNVRLFFDDVCESGDCGEDKREELPTPEKFLARVDQIAAAIERTNTDIVLLQEVESQACMDELEERLGDSFDFFLLGETRQPGTLDTAAIGRADVAPQFITHPEPFEREDGEMRKFLREFMEIRLELEGQEVIVFNAHLRSKYNDDAVQRRAEATEARRIALEVAAERPDAIIVLGGDLNDTPGSRTLDILEEDGAMTRVAAELAPDDWTINSRGNLRAIDHLYLIDDRGSYVAGSAAIVRDVNTLGGSDHAAVTAGFLP